MISIQTIWVVIFNYCRTILYTVHIYIYTHLARKIYWSDKAQWVFRQDFLEICTPILTLNVSHKIKHGKVLFTVRYTKRQITALTFFCHYKNKKWIQVQNIRTSTLVLLLICFGELKWVARVTPKCPPGFLFFQLPWVPKLHFCWSPVHCYLRVLKSS